MKRIAAAIIALVMLSGCTGKRDELDRVMALRAMLLACERVSFDAEITADYGDSLHNFAMSCTGDNDGNLSFTVTEPETISGITGRFEAGEGKLTFDDTALAFPLLADGQVAPVSGPWIFLKTLLGGYLTSCVQEEELLRVTIDDSYEDDALQLDIWFDSADKPLRAEIFFDNRRIVTMDIAAFEIL